MGKKKAECRPGREEPGRGLSVFRKITGMVCAIMAFACTGSFLLAAKAAPAVLSSPDATVYEQADEGSNAVGNLVEGSSFEYIGDVTAEDGSTWRQITTASGTTGYIKGDREIEVGEEPSPEKRESQQAPGGEDGLPAEEEAGPAEAQAGSEEGGSGAEAGSEEGAAEEDENRREEGEPQADGDGLETPEDNDSDDLIMADSNSRQNDRIKTYSLDTSGRIKEKLSALSDGDTVKAQSRQAAGRIDLTLLLSTAVVLLGAITVYFFGRKMKRLRSGTGEPEAPKESRNKTDRKNEKKTGNKKRRAGGRKQPGKGSQRRKKL